MIDNFTRIISDNVAGTVTLQRYDSATSVWINVWSADTSSGNFSLQNPSNFALNQMGLVIDVMRDYNASGSSFSTTGTMALGSTTLTLGAAGDFVNGQGVSVAGAASGGGLLVTSIFSGAGTTSLVLANAAGTAVSGATVLHDDTSAIQNGLTAAGDNGGGVVAIPYTLDGYRCGEITLPPGVQMFFEKRAKLIATSNVTTSWIKAQAVVHNGTAVVGGTYDATAITSSSSAAVIDFSAVTSCANTSIIGNRIISAPQAGIFLSESSGNWTAEAKWILNNSVDGHGRVSTGFGIYCDYIGSVLIEDNFVTSTGSSDAIELGHSGPENLGGLNARLSCVHNCVVNGEINFPHSNYALIEGNTVVGNTIQNDSNTADNVTIRGNTVINPNPASGFAGIVVAGDRALIEGNTVELNGSGDGIQGGTQITHNTIIKGNIVRNTSSTAAAAGISGGGATSTAASANNIIADNQVIGPFVSGIEIAGDTHQVSGNMLSLTGATNGIDLISSSITGHTPTGNQLTNNRITGATTPISNSGSDTDIAHNPGYNPVGSLTPPASPFASGTEYQNAYGVTIEIYQSAYATTSGTAGTITVALGPASPPSTIYAAQIGGGTSSTEPTTVFLRVPAAWWYTFTVSGATLLTASIQGE